MAFTGMVNFKKDLIPQDKPQTKVCSVCGVPKDLSEFHRKRESIDGREPRCKQCRSEKYSENKSFQEEKMPFDWVWDTL